MWKVKGTEVVWSEEKTADKPHWFTIATGLGTLFIGLVSLVSALYAVFISTRALSVSERAMKVGQRAYLSVDSGSFYISGGTNDSVWVALASIVRNTGNTPARIKETLTTYRLSDGWSISEYSLSARKRDPRAGLPMELAAKSDNKWSYDVMVTLTPTARKILFEQRRAQENVRGKSIISGHDIPLGARKEVRVSVTIVYSDVFNEEHYTRFCWRENGLGSPIPDSCFEDSRDSQLLKAVPPDR